MMTKKDYVLISSTINKNLAGCSSLVAHDSLIAQRVVRWVALDLSEALKLENPRFDCARFLAACGVQS